MIHARENISDLLIGQIVYTTSSNRTNHSNLSDKIESDTIEGNPGL